MVCDSCESAVEYMLACMQRMAAAAHAPCEADNDRAQRVLERASARLAALWGAEQHAVDFLLATHSLASLASVTSEEEWERREGLDSILQAFYDDSIPYTWRWG